MTCRTLRPRADPVTYSLLHHWSWRWARISKKDASVILKFILDGTGITRIEFRSAFHLLREFAFTDSASLFVEGLSPGVQIGLPLSDPTKTPGSPRCWTFWSFSLRDRRRHPDDRAVLQVSIILQKRERVMGVLLQ
jgi:hypothetical protein